MVDTIANDDSVAQSFHDDGGEADALHTAHTQLLLEQLTLWISEQQSLHKCSTDARGARQTTVTGKSQQFDLELIQHGTGTRKPAYHLRMQL